MRMSIWPNRVLSAGFNESGLTASGPEGSVEPVLYTRMCTPVAGECDIEANRCAAGLRSAVGALIIVERFSATQKFTGI